MAATELKDYIENGNIVNSVNLPCVKAQKSASHRYTAVSIDNGENRFGGISATRNGLRYTIIDTEDELTIDGEDVIKARKVY